jgi:hypothetical protein
MPIFYSTSRNKNSKHWHVHQSKRTDVQKRLKIKTPRRHTPDLVKLLRSPTRPVTVASTGIPTLMIHRLFNSSGCLDEI